MAQSTSIFPVSGLDTPSNANSGEFLSSLGANLGLPTVVNFIYGMLQNIEAKIGINGSSITTSVDYKIAKLSIGNYACSAYLNGVYTLPNNAATLIPFDTKIYDYNTNFSTSTHLYTIPVKGLYLVSGFISFVGSPVSDNALVILVNGVQTCAVDGASSTVMPVSPTMSIVLALNAADTIGIAGFQNSGAGVTIRNNSSNTRFSITCLSAQ